MNTIRLPTYVQCICTWTSVCWLQYFLPRATHSSGVRQSYSVSSNTSRGRKVGNVGEPPFEDISFLEVWSATGIRSDDFTLSSCNNWVIFCLAYWRLHLINVYEYKNGILSCDLPLYFNFTWSVSTFYFVRNLYFRIPSFPWEFLCGHGTRCTKVTRLLVFPYITSNDLSCWSILLCTQQSKEVVWRLKFGH